MGRPVVRGQGLQKIGRQWRSTGGEACLGEALQAGGCLSQRASPNELHQKPMACARGFCGADVSGKLRLVRAGGFFFSQGGWFQVGGLTEAGCPRANIRRRRALRRPRRPRWSRARLSWEDPGQAGALEEASTKKQNRFISTARCVRRQDA